MKKNQIKITYIGGGSRGWARVLMNDLAKDKDISGSVHLYDIDFEAAKNNAVIGNMLSARDDVVGKWEYIAQPNMGKALEGADFVVISVLPGTFDEMESDVHLPEKYGIYQSVGDTTGPGGIVRTLRTIPIFKEFALAIKKYCPDAWVINFTNPMAVSVRTLYEVFPQIKAFGCCHEVFGTQKMLAKMCNTELGMDVTREDICTNVLGVNHFTWIDQATCKGVDLFPVFDKYIDKNPDGIIDIEANNWAEGTLATAELVKAELFKRYGILAAAGDRHLAEFCPGSWFLESPEKIHRYGFNLTTVEYRRRQMIERVQAGNRLVEGEKMALRDTGEESVRQIKAILGFETFLTNVNIPNIGQMPELPIGAVVETNACFSGNSVRPVFAGRLPDNVMGLIYPIVTGHETVIKAALSGDYELAFTAFLDDPNMSLPPNKARELYNAMLKNTKNYLPYYDDYIKNI